MSEFTEAAEFLSTFKSGLDMVLTTLAALSIGVCGIRWIAAAGAEEARRVKNSTLYVLIAYAMYLLIPGIIKLIVYVAEAVG